MQEYDEIIAIVLPFAFSAIVIIFGGLVKTFANATIVLNMPKGMSEGVKNTAVDLASQIYVQVSFIFSTLSSCVACIAYTARSNRPVFASIAAVTMIALILIWFLKWQYLSFEEIKGKEGIPMRIAKWLTLVATFAITMYAWYSPVAEHILKQ